MHQILYSQKTSHNSPSRACYGVSFATIWVIIDRVITAPHFIRNRNGAGSSAGAVMTGNQMFTSKWRWLSWFHIVFRWKLDSPHKRPAVCVYHTVNMRDDLTMTQVCNGTGANTLNIFVCWMNLCRLECFDISVQKYCKTCLMKALFGE